MTVQQMSGIQRNYGQGMDGKKVAGKDQPAEERGDSVQLSRNSKIKVLEVDQWTSTGDIQNFTMEEFNLDRVKGGDSEAAKKIFGGYAAIREVSPEDSPHIGEVWFIADPRDHKLKFYRANYDSSD